MQLLCKTAVGGQALQSPNYYNILVVKEVEVSTFSESNSELQKEIIVRFFVISVKEDKI